MSATEQIRVSPEVKAALEAEKEPGESYNETLEHITAAAWEMNETLATRDADFDTPAVREEITVDLV